MLYWRSSTLAEIPQTTVDDTDLPLLRVSHYNVPTLGIVRCHAHLLDILGTLETNIIKTSSNVSNPKQAVTSRSGIHTTYMQCFPQVKKERGDIQLFHDIKVKKINIPMTTSKEIKLGKGRGAPWYPPLGETLYMPTHLATFTDFFLPIFPLGSTYLWVR